MNPRGYHETEQNYKNLKNKKKILGDFKNGKRNAKNNIKKTEWYYDGRKNWLGKLTN